jgi:tetratricopeptide (TPR) repeat protein
MKRILIILFLSCHILNISAQIKGELKDNFYWAETFVLYEEYKDALPLYQLLLKVNPRNTNYKYRIGQCLLNIPGRKQEAVSYLEEAVKDINPKYKEGRFKETKAPLDAYYYLANAYRITNQLDKAISTYEIFKKYMDPRIYDSTIVNLQIESCNNAMELMKHAFYIKKVNAGRPVNDQYADINPVVSDDETIMVYNKSEPFQEALYFTKKVNGKWTDPVNIIPYLGLGFEDKNYATSISSDGRELYIYRAGANYDGNIYMTRRRDDDTWTNLIRLNDNINTKYWESHAAISHNGKRLYFTSNRKGSYGGLDIYYSDRDTTGDWGMAKNIGPVINTKYNEESPFLGKDDKTLFFSSRGHFNIGGYDIFYSTLLDNGQWSTPLNVGYPLNTTDDDLFFYPVNEGYEAYYSMIEPDSYGLTDIYRIEIFTKDHPRKFFVRGIVKVKDLLSIFTDSIRVSAISKENPEARVVVYSNPVTGEYIFELPQGEYTITYEAKNAGLISRPLELSLFSPADTLQIPSTELPKLDLMADMDIRKEKNIIALKGDTIEIPVKVEPNSIMEVEHWLGDSLVRTDKYVITDSIFIYKAAPLSGDNRLRFKLTDKYSNVTASEISITRRKITEEKIVRPEYKYVIARKQVAAFIEMLKKRSEGELKKVIDKTDFSRQQFGKVDEIISYIKEVAVSGGIDAEKVDIIALKVAVMDNVLSQSAVDLMAEKTAGRLREVLSGLNIYEANLKTWSDLQRYVAEKTESVVTSENINRLAYDIIEGLDPLIAIIRSQILAYGEIAGISEQVMSAVKNTEAQKIKGSGEWLRSFTEEALKQKLAEPDIAAMFTALTSLPGTNIETYLKEFSGCSATGFALYLNGLDISEKGISTPLKLMSFLIKSRKDNHFSEDEYFEAVARFIAEKQINKEAIVIPEAEKKNYRFILWIILGAGVIFFIIILFRRKRRKEENEN